MPFCLLGLNQGLFFLGCQPGFDPIDARFGGNSIGRFQPVACEQDNMPILPLQLSNGLFCTGLETVGYAYQAQKTAFVGYKQYRVS